MLTAIHIVWAVMLWRASDDPARHSALYRLFDLGKRSARPRDGHRDAYPEGAGHDGDRKPSAARDSWVAVVAATEAGQA
jgi:hypothetical protein